MKADLRPEGNETKSIRGEYDRLAQIGVNDAELSVRTMNALQGAGRYKTLADLDRASDLELLAWPNIGKKGVREIRDAIRIARAGKLSIREEVLLWASEHETLVLALMRGEAVIVPKGRANG